MTTLPSAPALASKGQDAAIMVVRPDKDTFDAAHRRLFYRRADAQARRDDLCGALVFTRDGVVLGVQGGHSGVTRFTTSLAEPIDAAPAAVVTRQRVARRLFASKGLVMPWLRPGEAVWLETALKADPRPEDHILAFLSWAALRHTEAGAGLYGAAAGLAETWSPFDGGAEGQTRPPSETNLLSPS